MSLFIPLYYKDPSHDLSFIKAHKNTARSDWEKHLIATSPMYFKRVISLTDRQRKKMEMKENQTIWDKIMRHPVYIIIALLGSIASLIGLWYVFSPSNAIDQDAKIKSSPGSTIYQSGRDIVIQQSTPPTKDSIEEKDNKLARVPSKVMPDNETARQTVSPERKQQRVKPLFDITGATAEERSTIESRLVDLKIKAATINISKSERDNSRNIYIQVTYQDNTRFTDAFNTPLDNAASLIISEIDDKRRHR